MPLYNPEENQDDIAVPPGLQQPSYLPAGNAVANVPDQRLAASMSNTALPFNGVVRRAGSTNLTQAASMWPSQQKLGIGHQIVAMGQEPQASQTHEFSQRTEDQSMNGRSRGTMGIGHRILAVGSDRPGRAALQSQPFAKTSNTLQQSQYGTAMAPTPLLLHDQTQKQGIFSSFVPVGAHPTRTDPFSIASTGLNRLASGSNGLFLTAHGLGRNNASFGKSASNIVPKANGSGHAGIRTEQELTPTQVEKQKRHQQSKAQGLQVSRVSQAPRQAVAKTSPSPAMPEIETYIRQQAAAYGIPEALALGLVNKESHFDPNLRGALKEVGLFQIKPKSKPEIIEDAKGNKFAIDMKRAASDWKYNVTAGLALLKRAHKQAQKSSPKDVIAATYAHYNGGDKNWIYYTRKNAPVHYHIYGQSIKRHGKSVMGLYDFHRG